jgi:hypothetical protein
MQARATFRESAISKKTVLVFVALMAAFLLAGAGSYVIKTMTLPVRPAAAHMVQGQDSAATSGSAWTYSNRHSGTQSVQGPVPTSDPIRAGGRGGNQIVP